MCLIAREHHSVVWQNKLFTECIVALSQAGVRCWCNYMCFRQTACIQSLLGVCSSWSVGSSQRLSWPIHHYKCTSCAHLPGPAISTGAGQAGAVGEYAAAAAPPPPPMATNGPPRLHQGLQSRLVAEMNLCVYILLLA